MSTAPFSDLDELLQRLLDDQVGPEEMSRLQKAMREDPRVRDYYVDTMLACAVIRRSSQVTGELSKSDLIRALGSGGGRGSVNRITRLFYSIAAVLVLGALIFASLSHVARGPAIGTLDGTYEAQWKGVHPRPGQPLHAGAYDLREGLARMELDQGTSLLLEAPCRIELKSISEVYLKTGRLTVAVSPQVKGFQVDTPKAVITDLGTEFGVVVHSDGSTEAHVVKGSITVSLAPNKWGRRASLVVKEGLAAAVDASGWVIQGGLAGQADLFLLQLPSVSQPPSPAGGLDLADLVGGGNGRGTGTLDRGIDLGSGQPFQGPATVIRQVQRNGFRPSPQLSGIDGVFVPNGALGPVVISSTRLVFSQCPQTLGSYYGGPTNSGKFFSILTRQTYTARLDGISFGTTAHPALTLHPNAGVTFDLDRIRQDNPDIQIERFTAVCSIPKELPEPQFSPADVWVLLDGVVRLHLHYTAERNAVEKLDMPIPAQARFLTLVTTCSGRADYSWIFFGDPLLGPAAADQVEAAR